jgi:hypothetical protein
VTFRAAVRAATVEMLRDYAEDAEVKLQVYPGRPASINPPTAFVDVIRETLTNTGTGAGIQQRVPQADVILLHGRFDSADTVAQADAFVDGFVAWVKANYHAAGAVSLIEVVEVEDVPSFVPDWMAPENQRTYFGTRITLEGFQAN